MQLMRRESWMSVLRAKNKRKKKIDTLMNTVYNLESEARDRRVKRHQGCTSKQAKLFVSEQDESEAPTKRHSSFNRPLI